MLNNKETVRRALIAVGVIVLLLFLLAQTVQSRPEAETEKPEVPKEETDKPKEESQKNSPQQNKTANIVVEKAQPKPAVIPVVKSGATGLLNSAQLDFLWECESSRTPNLNTGNGYYGGFQFDIDTWEEVNKQYARADLAPHEVQVAAVQKLLSYSSIWDRLPSCAAQMRAAGLL